ncbi:MFS transporter [Ectothiorhodospiraceae bacterium 2226]|nr:MFS transporter [Ectothiorhodospiraceae bacterium 2226]
MAGFFPIFFNEYWGADLSATDGTFWLGVANSVSGALVILVAPLLGATADRAGRKKTLLLLATLLGIAMSTALYFVQQGQWVLAAAIYVLAMLGFSGSSVFYDALLLTVAPRGRVDFVSALGFAYGYLGGGLLFVLVVLMTLYPDAFGLPDAPTAVRVSFLLVALWWAVFCVPLFIWVPEPATPDRVRGVGALRAGWQRLRATFGEVRRLRMVMLFLIAYWFYIDGVHSIIRMATDYGYGLGFGREDLILALLLVQFIAFPMALVFGKLGQRLGAKTGIYIALGVYAGVVVWAYFIQHAWEFYVLAAAIGCVQGGVQALSRSYYSTLIPRQQSAEFFGFYNIMGKFAAVLGPLLIGTVAAITDSPRHSILSVLALFAIGALLLARVDQRQARALARASASAPQAGSGRP